jgi:hypothetical protein
MKIIKLSILLFGGLFLFSCSDEYAAADQVEQTSLAQKLLQFASDNIISEMYNSNSENIRVADYLLQKSKTLKFTINDIKHYAVPFIAEKEITGKASFLRVMLFSENEIPSILEIVPMDKEFKPTLINYEDYLMQYLFDVPTKYVFDAAVSEFDLHYNHTKSALLTEDTEVSYSSQNNPEIKSSVKIIDSERKESLLREDCVDYYLVTYIGDVIISEEYLYTECKGDLELSPDELGSGGGGLSNSDSENSNPKVCNISESIIVESNDGSESNTVWATVTITKRYIEMEDGSLLLECDYTLNLNSETTIYNDDGLGVLDWESALLDLQGDISSSSSNSVTVDFTYCLDTSPCENPNSGSITIFFGSSCSCD